MTDSQYCGFFAYGAGRDQIKSDMHTQTDRQKDRQTDILIYRDTPYYVWGI